MRWSERSRLHKKLIVLNGTSVSNPSSELKELCGRKGRKTAKTKGRRTARKQGLVDPAGPTMAGLQQQQQGQPGSAPDGISAHRSGHKPPSLPQKLSPPDNYLQMKN